MPPIPDTGWSSPTDFPDLAAAKVLSIDVETYDPELTTHGPGWARGVGHLVGLAVGTEDGFRRYYPMRHTIEKDYNVDPDKVLRWARVNLTRPYQSKIGANITYDVGWLRQEGVNVVGDLYDVQFAEALLSEAATVNLDDLGVRYLGYGKETNILYQWCSDFYGGAATSGQRANIYRAPPRLVGPYAEGDVDLPLRVIAHQWPLLEKQSLLELFSMENRLVYLMIAMRFAGVSVNLAHAEQMRDVLTKEIEEFGARIKALVGFDVNTSAASSMVDAFNVLGLPYGRTIKGNPTFTKAVLEKIDHPFAELVLEQKAREKLLGTFVEGYILESHVKGKIFGSFHQLRGDEEGARSGRFSSDHPNLQNIPARSKIGKVIRQAFVPDEGHACWRKYDYSQIEYRGLAHYAVGPKADEIRARYNQDSSTDFHVLVQSIIHDVAGLSLERPLVKNVNFGTVYGMGRSKLAMYLKLSKSEADKLFAAIHEAAPFLRATMDATMEEAATLGYITTILGRRSRFDTWVPDTYNPDAKPLPYDTAILTYRNPVRAYLHKALNRRLQGSAADLIKLAMLKCWEDGIFAETGVPRLTVHDELDFSDPGGNDVAFVEMQRVMETAIRFRVPVQVTCGIGPSWGEVKDPTT